MQGAEDVKLDHSTLPDDAGASSDSASASGECGVTDGKANYEFQVDVSFSAPSGDSDEPGSVPARLGGGQ